MHATSLRVVAFGGVAAVLGLLAWARVAPGTDAAFQTSPAQFARAAKEGDQLRLADPGFGAWLDSIPLTGAPLDGPDAARLRSALREFLERRFLRPDAAEYRRWRSAACGKMLSPEQVPALDQAIAMRYVYGVDVERERPSETEIFDRLFLAVVDEQARTPRLVGWSSTPAQIAVARAGEARLALDPPGFWYGYISAGGACYWKVGKPAQMTAEVGLATLWSDGSRLPLILTLSRARPGGAWEVTSMMLNNFPETFDVPPIVY